MQPHPTTKNPTPLASGAPVDDALAQHLFDAALAARVNAHAPYSRFQVGAALLDEQGRIHAGCNVENAAYPQGVCAEGGALSAMVLAGGRSLRAVMVVGAGEGLCTSSSVVARSAASASTTRWQARVNLRRMAAM